MRYLLCASMLAVALLSGCGQPTETLPTVGNDSGPATSGTTIEETTSEAPPAGEGASVDGDPAVRFVANKRLSVPGMTCPYGCYPTVEGALAKLPGVEAVQLAEQPAGTPEGSLATKVVELKVAEGFDLTQAIAALKAVDFDATEM